MNQIRIGLVAALLAFTTTAAFAQIGGGGKRFQVSRVNQAFGQSRHYGAAYQSGHGSQAHRKERYSSVIPINPNSLIQNNTERQRVLLERLRLENQRDQFRNEHFRTMRDRKLAADDRKQDHYRKKRAEFERKRAERRRTALQDREKLRQAVELGEKYIRRFENDPQRRQVLITLLERPRSLENQEKFNQQLIRILIGESKEKAWNVDRSKQLERESHLSDRQRIAEQVRDVPLQVNGLAANAIPGGQGVLAAQEFAYNTAEHGVQQAVTISAKDAIVGKILGVMGKLVGKAPNKNGLSPSRYPNPDPPMSAPAVRYKPQSLDEVVRMRQGKGPTTKATHGRRNIEAHHRQQRSVENGGILDELEMETHRGPGNHTRHNRPSELTPAQRAKEIREHWKKRGGEYILPGEGI